MKSLLDAFIKNDDSYGGTLHFMKELAGLESAAEMLTKETNAEKEDVFRRSDNTQKYKEECSMENFKTKTAPESIAALENIADTYYDGRTWEDIPTEELTIIVNMSKVIAQNPYSEKAAEILAERKAAVAADIKSLDDGTVRGLITSNDKYMKIVDKVGIQRTLNGEREWIWKNGRYESGTIYNAESISGWSWSDVERIADDIVTLCRRKFKKEEIILYTFDDISTPTRGIVFLEDKICSFDEKKLEYIISYAEMGDIDFTEDSVTISVSGGEDVSIYCGDEEEYAQGVYNLLMDIKDRLG